MQVKTTAYPPSQAMSVAEAAVVAIERRSSLESGELETIRYELLATKEALGYILEQLPDDIALSILNKMGYRWEKA